MTRSAAARSLSLALLLAVLSTLASAEPPKREWRVLLGASARPPGVLNNIDLSWRFGLSRSANPLLSDAHLTLGLSSSLSPAYERLGAWLQIAPLSIIDVRVGVEPVAYFGSFGALAPYPSRDADFSRDTRKAKRDETVRGTGTRLFVAPALKARIGHVVATARLELEWWRVDGPGPFYYEVSRDTLLASGHDRVRAGSASILYDRPRPRGGRIEAGLNYALTDVPDAPQNRIQRGGLLGLLVLADRRRMKEPTVYLVLPYYLEHPYQRHQLGLQAAFAFGIR